MNKKHIVLVFDIGTQSTRALLIDASGKILAKAQRGHHPAYISEKSGYAEQDPEFYYDNICRVSRQLKENFEELFSRIEAVALTTIRSTSVCVGKDGKALRPAILWLDQRKASGKAKLNPVAAAAIKAVGMDETVQIQYEKSHCNWIMEHEPEIWAKTDKYVLLGTYLNSRLTGRMADSSASIVGYVPYNFKKRCWKSKHDLVRPVFDMPDSMMCDIVDPGEVIGYITPEASADTGLPEGMALIGTGSDKACEILGLGCVNQNRAALSFASAATVAFTTKKYLEPSPFLPAYDSIIPEHFTPEIQICRGYWLVSWFKREFAYKEMQEAVERNIPAEELLNERLKEIPAGCDGLIMQPYFTPNLTMPSARGAVIGLSDVHTRVHLYRAIIEGINFALMDGMKQLERRGKFKFKEIRVGGGGAQSSEICQITANMFGLPVVRTQTYEVSGIGAAITLFVSLGVFDSYTDALKAMVHKKDVFEPNEEEHEFYEKLYGDIYQKIYNKLSPLYRQLDKMR